MFKHSSLRLITKLVSSRSVQFQSIRNIQTKDASSNTSKLQVALPIACGAAAMYLFSMYLFQKPNEDTKSIKATSLESSKVNAQFDDALSENTVEFSNLSTKEVLEAQPDKSQVYNSIATKYDDQIKFDELVMGLYLFRRYLIKRHAKGDVLELSAGTARNMKYYSSTVGSKYDIDSLTLVDQSQEMLENAQSASRTQNLITKFKQTRRRMRFYTRDCHNLIDFQNDQFDTVVDTFGLCSYRDPVQAIQEMKRVCKPDGEILLLQHGLSVWGFLNGILHNNAHKHAHKWGCWWNRDIEEICKLADLDITYQSRWHFGTTYYIIAKPNKKSLPEVKA